MLTDYAVYPEDGELVRRAIIRASDGLLFDFTLKTFSDKSADVLQPMPEHAPPLTRLHVATVDTPKDVFPDGDYLSAFLGNDGRGGVFDLAMHTLRDGDEVGVFPMASSIPFNFAGSFNLKT